jgi:hypothetical protein
VIFQLVPEGQKKVRDSRVELAPVISEDEVEVEGAAKAERENRKRGRKNRIVS